MKIARIESYALRVPLGSETFHSSQAPFPERTSCLVRLETDDGLVGWGEGGQWGPPEPVAAMIDRVLAPRLLGTDPLKIAVLWEQLYAYVRDWSRTGTGLEALSAIDIALWDIAGKALGQPVSTLLGGAHRGRLVAYATGCYYRGGRERWADTRALANEARGYLETGFRALKMKIGLLSPAQDLARVRAVRDALGPDVPLMVDANHAYTPHVAIAIGRGLQEAGVYWFEEPVVPEDLAGYAQVATALDLAVAGGECEYARYGFRDLFVQRCVDIAQPDVCCVGGLTEARNIAALASAFGVQVIPHVWGSGVAIAAALHFAATLPASPATANPLAPHNEPVLEFDCNPNPLRDELLADPMRLGSDGTVAVPTAPGLGVTVVEEVLRAYTV